MDTATITYLGELRCGSIHVRSGNTIITDAPVDNHGQGAAHSPTDLLCVSLCTCMLTTMAIHAPAKGIELKGVSARVVKHMANDPRRVVRIETHITMEGGHLDERERMLLERIAHTCPVARSIHPDILQETTFTYR